MAVPLSSGPTNRTNFLSLNSLQLLALLNPSHGGSDVPSPPLQPLARLPAQSSATNKSMIGPSSFGHFGREYSAHLLVAADDICRQRALVGARAEWGGELILILWAGSGENGEVDAKPLELLVGLGLSKQSDIADRGQQVALKLMLLESSDEADPPAGFLAVCQVQGVTNSLGGNLLAQVGSGQPEANTNGRRQIRADPTWAAPP